MRPNFKNADEIAMYLLTVQRMTNRVVTVRFRDVQIIYHGINQDGEVHKNHELEVFPMPRDEFSLIDWLASQHPITDYSKIPWNTGNLHAEMTRELRMGLKHAFRWIRNYRRENRERRRHDRPDLQFPG